MGCLPFLSVSVGTTTGYLLQVCWRGFGCWDVMHLLWQVIALVCTTQPLWSWDPVVCEFECASWHVPWCDSITFALVGQLCIVVVVQWLALHPFCRVSWCVWFGVYSGTCLFVQWSLCQSRASELCSLFWQMELSVRCLDHLSMYPCHCQCYSWWVDYNLIQHWNTSCVESCDCSFHRWCFHLSMHLQTLASQHWLFIGPLASQDVLLPSWVARTLLIITLICSRNSLHL